MAPGTVICGWLLKRGVVLGNWVRRFYYVSIADGTFKLCYKRAPSDPVPKGELLLTDFDAMAEDDTARTAFLIEAAGRVIVLRAATPRERARWLGQLALLKSEQRAVGIPLSAAAASASAPSQSTALPGADGAAAAGQLGLSGGLGLTGAGAGGVGGSERECSVCARAFALFENRYVCETCGAVCCGSARCLRDRSRPYNARISSSGGSGGGVSKSRGRAGTRVGSGSLDGNDDSFLDEFGDGGAGTGAVGVSCARCIADEEAAAASAAAAAHAAQASLSGDSTATGAGAGSTIKVTVGNGPAPGAGGTNSSSAATGIFAAAATARDHVYVRVVEADSLVPASASGRGRAQCDPYVVVRFDGHQRSTSVENRTTRPVWRQDFEFPVNVGAHVLELWVFDYDLFGAHACIGYVRIPVAHLDSSRLYDEWFVLRPPRGGAMRRPTGKLHLLIFRSTTTPTDAVAVATTRLKDVLAAIELAHAWSWVLSVIRFTSPTASLWLYIAFVLAVVYTPAEALLAIPPLLYCMLALARLLEGVVHKLARRKVATLAADAAALGRARGRWARVAMETHKARAHRADRAAAAAAASAAAAVNGRVAAKQSTRGAVLTIAGGRDRGGRGDSNNDNSQRQQQAPLLAPHRREFASSLVIPTPSSYAGSRVVSARDQDSRQLQLQTPTHWASPAGDGGANSFQQLPILAVDAGPGSGLRTRAGTGVSAGPALPSLSLTVPPDSDD